MHQLALFSYRPLRLRQRYDQQQNRQRGISRLSQVSMLILVCFSLILSVFWYQSLCWMKKNYFLAPSSIQAQLRNYQRTTSNHTQSSGSVKDNFGLPLPSIKNDKRKPLFTIRKNENKSSNSTIVKIPSITKKFYNLMKEDFPGQPPISSLIKVNKVHQTAEVVGDVSFLLDFAIIGFPKTGTTSLLQYLSNYTNTHREEKCEMVIGDVPLLVNHLYDPIKNLTRGIKCPQDISSELSLLNYAKYFPNTKLVVGLRHPIPWFESLYNFHSSRSSTPILPTSKLTKRCIAGSQGVCAWRANFADFLSRLGKTPRMSIEEENLLSLNLPVVPGLTGHIFLYDVSQLSNKQHDDDNNKQLVTTFRKDLANFLGIEFELDEIPFLNAAENGHFRLKYQIKICDDEHKEIRAVLLDMAKKTSEWIRKYFLASDDVFVSSRNEFIEIMERWMKDPCELNV